MALVEVLLFPYLPLAQRREVGPWRLIPREQLTAEDTTGEQMVELAAGAAKLYRLPGHDRGYGAFIHRDDQPVGEEINPDRLRTLYHAIVVSLLDDNPSRAVAGMVDDDNSGHRMCTTENALLFGHRFDHLGSSATGCAPRRPFASSPAPWPAYFLRSIAVVCIRCAP